MLKLSFSINNIQNPLQRHYPGPIRESKGMHAIFQKKGKKGQKKKQNNKNFGQKCTKFENILKKGK